MRFALIRRGARIFFLCLLLSCLVACGSHALVGKWRCDDTLLKYELFTLGGVSRWDIRPTGEVESRIEYVYSFPGHGTVAALVVVVADWETKWSRYIEYTREVSIEEFWTDLEIPRDFVETELKKIHPLDEDWQVDFLIETPDTVYMSYPDGEEKRFRCYRQDSNATLNAT